MEEALIARLLGVSSIIALVADRINWFERPQGKALPALTLSRTGPGRDYTHSGPSELEHPRIQVDCWSATKAGALHLATLVVAALEPGATVGGIKFERGFLVGEGSHDPTDLGGGAKAYGVHRDLIIWHRPS